MFGQFKILLVLHDSISNTKHCPTEPICNTPHQYSDELRTLVAECIRVDPDKRPDAKHVHETAKDMFKE